VMGNLDPVVLFANQDMLRAQARRIIEQASGRAGHIFNLGHGILPETPVENVIALVEMVHEMSRG
jgi:uroporphyrinogen decarboxylase